MNDYWNKLHPDIKQYFEILEKDMPEFLLKYMETPELKRLKHIGYFCGMDYCSKAMYQFKLYFSRCDHSLAVALITWHFTKSRAATVAALLHDISSPVFSHVVDFMRGDKMTQEYTEKYTEEIIRNSVELNNCLKQDNLTVEQVSDLKQYPLGDNDRPKLCADRLEGTFSNLMYWDKSLSLDEVKTIYQTICVTKNEEKEPELGFQTAQDANKFFDLTLRAGYLSHEKEDALCMQLLADTLKEAEKKHFLTEKDLFEKTEPEIVRQINRIPDPKIRRMWTTFQTIQEVYTMNQQIPDTYYAIPTVKKRIVDPLYLESGKPVRVLEQNSQAKIERDKYLNYQVSDYVYIKKNI